MMAVRTFAAEAFAPCIRVSDQGGDVVLPSMATATAANALVITAIDTRALRCSRRSPR